MTQSEADTALADRLYATHMAFELAQWRGPARHELIAREVAAFWSWAQVTPLRSVVHARYAHAAAERVLLDVTLPQSLSTTLGRLAAALINLDINRDTRLCDVVDETLFNDGVTLFIELERLRERVLSKALDSPVYAALVSEVLYQGIKDYMFSDANAFSGIPGVSSLLKGSASAVNRRVPGFEAQVEKRVRAYIEANLARTLARSQARLLETLDAPRIRALAADVWAQTRDNTLSVTDMLADDDVDALAAFGVRVWRELRQTPYMAEVLEAALEALYAQYGERPLSDLFEQFGVTRHVLAQEVDALADPVIDALLESGGLEAFIARRLQPFYASAAFAQALQAP